ncbi:MAG: MFS transporter [Ardenticatenaceae bacterium]|nr:MFS transporter [Ardenticatenaceae bacterium]
MNSSGDGEPWRRNERVVVTSVMLHAAAMAAATPIIPLFVQDLGAASLASAALWSGLALTASPFFAAILAPVWGLLADRYGLKPMVQRAQLASSLALLGMAAVWNVQQLLALRVGLGILGGYGAMSVALVAASVPQQETGAAIGRLQAGRIAGLGIGPLVGGLVVAGLGERAVFVASALLSTLNFGLITWLYDEPALRKVSGAGTPSHFSFRSAGRIPNYIAVLVILFLVRFSERSLDPIIPLAVTNTLGEGPAVPVLAGAILSLGTFASALSSHFGGHLLSQYQPRRLLLGSLAGGAICALFLALAHSVVGLGAWRLGLGLLAGGAQTLAYGIASLTMPAEGRASAYGLLSSGALLGGALAPLFAGLLTVFGLQAAFLLSAGLYLMAEMATLVGVDRVETLAHRAA